MIACALVAKNDPLLWRKMNLVEGGVPQDLKYRGEHSRLEIGPRTKIREHVTINTGTEGGGGVTRIGADCLLMAGAHVAHDVMLGDGVILVNHAAIAGHCQIGDGAIIGGLSGSTDWDNYSSDYFFRFDLAYDHFSQAANQLKAWIDPDGAGRIGPYQPVHKVRNYGYNSRVAQAKKKGEQRFAYVPPQQISFLQHEKST